MYPVGKKQRRTALRSESGYTLIEIIVVVMIISVLATVTVRSLRNSTDVARTNRTRIKLDQLANAITGNPELIAGGSRVDFGFVGDVGALPTNLNALITNPGLATWNGPYLRADFTLTGAADNRLKDAWGKDFVYAGSTTISSSGGGFSMTRSVANSMAQLLLNQVRLTILDADLSPPGTAYADSVSLQLYLPNGTGSMTTKITNPAGDGSASFSSVPIGRHSLEIIFLPAADTLRRMLSIEPGSTSNIEILFPTDLW